MTQASFASAGVRRNVLARIAAGGPGFGPKAFKVKSARTSCVGCAGTRAAPSKGQIRTITGNLTRDGNTGDFKCDYGSCFEVLRDQQRWTLLHEIGSGSAAHETPLVISN